jgi:hypothetical protein
MSLHIALVGYRVLSAHYQGQEALLGLCHCLSVAVGTAWKLAYIKGMQHFCHRRAVLSRGEGAVEHELQLQLGCMTTSNPG